MRMFSIFCFRFSSPIRSGLIVALLPHWPKNSAIISQFFDLTIKLLFVGEHIESEVVYCSNSRIDVVDVLAILEPSLLPLFIAPVISLRILALSSFAESNLTVADATTFSFSLIFATIASDGCISLDTTGKKDEMFLSVALYHTNHVHIYILCV